MAKNKQQRNTGRMQEDQDQDMDQMDSSDEEMTTGRGQQGRGTQKQAQGQGQQAQGGRRQGGQVATQGQGGPQDILASIRPALDEARGYIEGSPIRAAAIGAVAGGLLMTLFSTEKGRSFVKLAYDYANPMVAKYARDFISQQAGNMAESALSQH